ncbi:9554_t:CDS:2, partial [Entrophospora sp. SA101]
ELENSALFEETIRKILRNFQKSSTTNDTSSQQIEDTEDEEVIEDMEINFVWDKDAIDVPTVRGKIKRLVLLAIMVDPGSNTLLMSRDIAERLESISKIELIECWLLHYAAACKGETSKQAINQRSPEFY